MDSGSTAPRERTFSVLEVLRRIPSMRTRLSLPMKPRMETAGRPGMVFCTITPGRSRRMSAEVMGLRSSIWRVRTVETARIGASLRPERAFPDIVKVTRRGEGASAPRSVPIAQECSKAVSKSGLIGEPRILWMMCEASHFILRPRLAADKRPVPHPVIERSFRSFLEHMTPYAFPKGRQCDTLPRGRATSTASRMGVRGAYHLFWSNPHRFISLDNARCRSLNATRGVHAAMLPHGQ